mgnify:FL=1
MARIFIALRFGDEVKKALVALQNALRAQGVEGNYCAWGNLHMTLAFIGERYDLPTIRQAVNEVRFEPFTMTLGPLGTFTTKAGVVWCGVSDGEAVTALANQLRERLTAHGVAYSATPFLPHISLVQRPSHIVTHLPAPQVAIPVERIYVMKSERIDGQLVYSEI